MRVHFVGFLAVVLLIGTGCAQVMAVRQPGPIDRSPLTAHAERGAVIAVLGPPVATDDRGNRLTETYTYTDGGKVNTVVGKSARILLYSAGDFFTAFLSQVLWMPAELLLDGTDYSTDVEYVHDVNERWVAERIVERKLEGDREVVVLVDPNVSVAQTEDAVSPDLGEGNAPSLGSAGGE